MKRLFSLYVSILTVGFFAMGSSAQGNPSPQPGEIFPDTELLSIEGMPVSLRPPEGKFLLIQFWDIGAEPSKQTATDLNQLYNRFHESGLNMIGICIDSSEDNVAAFAQNRQLLWPLVMNQQERIKLTEKYKVTDNPFNLIIDSTGKVLATQLVGMEAHEDIAKILGVSLDEVPLEPVKTDWKETFYSVYSLDEGEFLKRIPTPFIPERLEYYQIEHDFQANSIPDGPLLMVFHWDGKLQNWGMSFGGEQVPLSNVLTFPLGLASFEFEGPEDLEKLNVPGDWIVRIPSTPEERIHALEKILQTELKEPIHFELCDLEREVIVASGEYAYHPLEGFEKDNRTDTIHVFSDADKIRKGGGGGSGTLKEFLRSFGSLYQVHLIDETQPSGVMFSYRWRQSHMPSDQSNIDGYLETIAKQTSIQFHKEIRKVPIWVIRKSEK